MPSKTCYRNQPIILHPNRTAVLRLLRGGAVSCPSSPLSLSNSRSTFNGPGACREPAMKPTAGLSRLDPNSTGPTLPIPSTTFRALATSKRRTPSPISRIARQADASLHSKLSHVVPRYSCHERHAAGLIPLPAGGPAAIMRANSALRACSP